MDALCLLIVRCSDLLNDFTVSNAYKDLKFFFFKWEKSVFSYGKKVSKYGKHCTINESVIWVEFFLLTVCLPWYFATYLMTTVPDCWLHAPPTDFIIFPSHLQVQIYNFVCTITIFDNIDIKVKNSKQPWYITLALLYISLQKLIIIIFCT